MQYLNLHPPKCREWTQPSSEAVIIVESALSVFFMSLSAWSPVCQYRLNMTIKENKSLLPDFTFQGRLPAFLSHDSRKESGTTQSSAAVCMTHLVTNSVSWKLTESSISPFNLSWDCYLWTWVPGTNTRNTHGHVHAHTHTLANQKILLCWTEEILEQRWKLLAIILVSYPIITYKDTIFASSTSCVNSKKDVMLTDTWTYPSLPSSSKSELQKLIEKQLFLFLIRAPYFPRKIKFLQITSFPGEWKHDVWKSYLCPQF